MKAVVLAAGTARRMRPLSDNVPKCLLPVGGKPILEHIIENIAAAGISRIGLVVGYRAVAIRSFVKSRFPFLRIRFLINPKFESTNNAFSLLMARDFALDNSDPEASDRSLLLLDSDILFPRGLLPFLISRKRPDKVAVRVEGAHDKEEMRVNASHTGIIRSIGKTVPMEETFGESVGIEQFCLSTTERLFDVLEARVRSGIGRTEFYEASFQSLIDEGNELYAVDVSMYPTLEIDTPDDLRLAESIASDTGSSSQS